MLLLMKMMLVMVMMPLTGSGDCDGGIFVKRVGREEELDGSF